MNSKNSHFILGLIGFTAVSAVLLLRKKSKANPKLEKFKRLHSERDE